MFTVSCHSFVFPLVRTADISGVPLLAPLIPFLPPSFCRLGPRADRIGTKCLAV